MLINKKIVLLLIIFFAIAIIIFIYFYNKPDIINNAAHKNEAEESQPVKIENQLTNQEKRINDIEEFESAKVQKDFAQCNEIKDIYTSDLCFKQIALDLSDNSGCAYIENKQEQKMCSFIIYKRKALEDKKVDPCYELKDQNLIDRCVKQVVEANFCSTEECFNDFLQNKANYDTDKDGLTDNQEIYIYFTDSNIIDTDGDGYSDGDEVRAGYNPNGEGEL
ncbi:hypothetical protein KAR28_03230 [Candidatus Parcubacteria bacterium]|nr:hypothetical protein [Candidatus Parcubacteria bacterium]